MVLKGQSTNSSISCLSSLATSISLPLMYSFRAGADTAPPSFTAKKDVKISWPTVGQCCQKNKKSQKFLPIFYLSDLKPRGACLFNPLYFYALKSCFDCSLCWTRCELYRAIMLSSWKLKNIHEKMKRWKKVSCRMEWVMLVSQYAFCFLGILELALEFQMALCSLSVRYQRSIGGSASVRRLFSDGLPSAQCLPPVLGRVSIKMFGNNFFIFAIDLYINHQFVKLLMSS